MGSNNNQKQQNVTQAPQAPPNYNAQTGALQQPQGYGPNANPSGSDPRGVGQNQSQYQQQRYEQQQGPLANQAAVNYGQASTQGMNDYNSIMNQYSNFSNSLGGGQQQGPQPSYQQSGAQGGSTGGGPQGNFDPKSYNPSDPQSVDAYISYMQNQPGVNPSVKNDPGYWRQKMLASTDQGGLGPDANYVMQKMMTPEGAPAGSSGGGGGGSSYGYGMSPLSQQAFGSAMQGYQGFANTGGYSPTDIANLRARGTSPIRAAYANAQDAINRQRSLQGGYAPNAIATQAKMAREQGQGMADAMQNVEGGIVNQRNQNQLAGMAGLSQTGLAGAGLGLNYDQLRQSGLLGSLAGQAGMYGATPGMASTFGNQAIGLAGQGGDFGNNLYRNDIQNQQNPGAFQTDMSKIGSVANTTAAIANPLLDYFKKKQQPDGGMYGVGGGGGANVPYDPSQGG